MTRPSTRRRPPSVVVLAADRALRESLASALAAARLTVATDDGHLRADRCGAPVDVAIIDLDSPRWSRLVERVAACSDCAASVLGVMTFPDAARRKAALAAGASAVALKRSIDEIAALVRDLAGQRPD